MRRYKHNNIIQSLGQSTVNTNEVSAIFNIGAHDNLIATTTVITMDRLESGDEIFVAMRWISDRNRNKNKQAY